MCVREARDRVPLEDFLQQGTLSLGHDPLERTPGLHKYRLLASRLQAHLQLPVARPAAVQVLDVNQRDEGRRQHRQHHRAEVVDP